MFPILECDIHIHQPFQVGDVFRNYCEHKPNTSSEKHDWNTRVLTLSLYSGLEWSERGILKCPLSPCVEISVECRAVQASAGLQHFTKLLVLPARAGPCCLAQVTGPVTGPTLIKREITTFLASPPPTVCLAL